MIRLSHSKIAKIGFISLLVLAFLAIPVSAAWAPVTITDATGTEVIISEQPVRIVSLSPTVAEILFTIGAGEQVVASTTATNYPEAAAKLPTVGDYANINNESVIAMSPNLVIGEKSMVKMATVEYLREHGVNVLILDSNSIEGTLGSIKTIGKATGHTSEAETIVSSLEDEMKSINELTSSIPENEKVRVAQLNWNNPLNVSGSNTMQDSIIRAAGCVNAFSDVDGWGNVNIERFIVVNPDLIVITKNMGMGETDEEVIKKYFGSDSRLQQLSAYKNNKIIVVDGDLMDRSGPRFIQAVEKINGVLCVNPGAIWFGKYLICEIENGRIISLKSDRNEKYEID